MKTLELINVGPITHASIPFPGPGQMVVLRGRNGIGKTTALEHIETVITGRGKGNVRDGAASGSVEAFGVTLKLGRSTRRSGELCVESLEGKLNISDLIDPGFKDPKAADATRIKALVQIANVLPCPDLFYPLVGGREQLEKLAGKTALESDDLVTMAERIKRDLEAAARREEDQASHAEGRARGAREAGAGVDVGGKSDAEVLSHQLNAAIREEATLRAEQVAAVKARQAAQLAKDQLADAEAAYSGPTIENASEAEEQAKAMQVFVDGPAKELAVKLQEAKHVSDLAQQRLQTSELTAGQLRAQQGKAKEVFEGASAKAESLRKQLQLAEQHVATTEAQMMDANLQAEGAAVQAEKAKQAQAEAYSLVLVLSSEHQAAQQRNERACQTVASAIVARKTADAHEASMSQWRNQVASDLPAEPAPEALTAAGERVAQCHADCEQGALIRRAKQHLAEADKHVATASDHRKAAGKLRDAAKGTDDVLSEVVAKSGSKLRVEQGRLVLDTKRGATFFHELSAGERARIAVDVGIDAMPAGAKAGVILLSQEIFEGLDGLNRDALKSHITERGVGILTAEASCDEEITAEVLA